MSGLRYIIAVFLLLQEEKEKEEEKKKEDEREEEKMKVEMKEGEHEKEKRKEKEEKEDKKKVEEEEVNIVFDDDVQDLAFVQAFLSTYRDNRTIASKHSDVCTALSSLPPSHISPG